MAIAFPDNPAPIYGDTHTLAGVKYMYIIKSGRGYWTSVPDELDPPTGDFVKIPGDTMTGSLSSPDFIGNFGVDKLQDLS